MNICIGSDHAGYQLKEKIKNYLQNKGYIVLDEGTNTPESVDYPDFAHRVAQQVLTSKDTQGILICGTGNGISIAANKHKGIRAAVCWNTEVAKLAKQHNNANIISLPARFITEKQAIDILDAFFMAVFEGGRHQNRINKIDIC
jgi:ribose 5-phosphate isomerase B